MLQPTDETGDPKGRGLKSVLKGVLKGVLNSVAKGVEMRVAGVE